MIPRQSRGHCDVSRSKRLDRVADATPAGVDRYRGKDVTIDLTRAGDLVFDVSENHNVHMFLVVRMACAYEPVTVRFVAVQARKYRGTRRRRVVVHPAMRGIRHERAKQRDKRSRQ
jgi:hypothetical protein